MEVRIEYNTFLLRQITGRQHQILELPESVSLRQVIEELVRMFGEQFRHSVMQENYKQLKMMIVINGKNITEMDTSIGMNSKIVFFQLATSG